MSAKNDGPNHDRFEAWLRGELDEAESERVLTESHSDAAVAEEVAAHAELIAQVGRLPRERAPERDLWPEIAARLAPARPDSGRRWRLAGLAAALVVAGAFLLLDRPAGPPVARRGVDAPPLAAPAAAPGTRPLLAAYAATGAELDAIRDRLRDEVERRGAELPPAELAVVQEHLATIDRAIAAIEAELAHHPEDAALARTSIAYRQRQIELLRRVNQTAARL